MKLFFYLFLTVIFLSCTSPNSSEIVKNSVKELSLNNSLISSFSIRMKDNPFLHRDYIGVIRNNKIEVIITEKENLSSIKACFEISENASIYVENVIQESAVTENNYYVPIEYTIKKNGVSLGYVVKFLYDPFVQFAPESCFILEDNEAFILNDFKGEFSNNTLFFYLPLESKINNVQVSLKNNSIGISEKINVDLSDGYFLNVETPYNISLSIPIEIIRVGYIPMSFVIDTLIQQIEKALITETTFDLELPDGYNVKYDKFVNCSFEFDKFVIENSSEASFLEIELTRQHDKAVMKRLLSYNTGAVIVDEEDEEVEPNLIIYGFSPGSTGNANNEFVILYNMNNKVIDLSGFKIKYASSSGLTQSLKYEFPRDYYLLNANSFLLITGKSYQSDFWNGNTFADITADKDFGFASSSGHIMLLDNNDNEIDRVGYGEAQQAEVEAIQSVSNMFYCHRIEIADTNNNQADFIWKNNGPLFNSLDIFIK